MRASIRSRVPKIRRRRFLAQFEQLERRDVLASATLVVDEIYAIEGGQEAKVTFTLTTPYTITSHYRILSPQWNGDAEFGSDYDVSYDPEPDWAEFWPSSVTVIELTITATVDLTDPMVESIEFFLDGVGDADPFVTNEVTLYVIDTLPIQSSPADVQIAEPSCSCSAGSDGSSSESGTNSGSNIVLPPVQSDAFRIYGPRYSTNEFRPVARTVDSRFAYDTGTPTSVVVNGTYYDATGTAASDVFRVGELMDVSVLAAGRYTWSMDIEQTYSSGPTLEFEVDGASLVAGPSNVLMSPGWHIAGIDRLTVTPDGALWQSDGDRLIWFTEDSGNYLPPAGDQDQSTLVDNLDGTFTLSNRWGDYQTFNSLGLVMEKVDRNGRTTTFTYTDADSDSDADDILEIETFDGRTMEYAYSGSRISSITDFDGRAIALAYDVNDKLESITYPDPDGVGPLAPLVSSYTYATGTSYLETIDDGGSITEFTYDFAGALIQRENPDSTIEVFESFVSQTLLDPGSGLGTALNPAPLAVVSEIVAIRENEDGEQTTYQLNAMGLPILMTDALGNETVYERDANGRITRQVDPDPDGVGSEAAPETLFEYDSAGNLIEQTLPDGSVRTWVYDTTWNVPTEYEDERGLLTIYDINSTNGFVDSIRQVVGEVDDLINLETDDVVTEYTYTVAPTVSTDPPAGLVATEKDPLGRITAYTYNARGRVTSTTYADGTADEATAYTYYNTDGTIDYELDELSRRTDYGYDLLGRLTLKTLPDPDAGGPLARPEIEYEYDVYNRLTKETDPLERETIYTYDARGRRTKVERPDHDGDTVLTTTTTKYNDLGQVEKATDALGRETTYEYDKLGRQTKVTMPQVADPTTAVNEIQIVDFDSGTAGTFKLNGNSKNGVIDLADLSDFQTILDGIWGAGNTRVVVTSTEATITFRGDLSATNVAEMTITDISGTGGATPFVSTDKAGEAADLVNPTTITTYDPLGRVISTKDALDQVTTYEYTNFGRNLKITLPDPDESGALSAPEIYQEFDAAGNLTSEKDANGNITTREYDILGRLTKVTQTDPGNGAPVTEYEYDLAGNLRYVTDPLGNRTEYQYDNRNRQVKVITPDPDGAGALSALTTEYTFDDAGQLTKLTAPGGRTTEYDYDDLGRLVLTQLPDPDGAGGLARPELASSYDTAGRKATDTDALGNVTSYTYDALDHVTQVTQPDPDGGGGLAAPVSKWEYDAAGQLLEMTDVLGNVTTYEYDALGRTLKVTQPDPDAGGSQTSPITKYEYSLTGNLLKVLDPLKNETTYEYDYLDRKTLSRDALGGETVFEYDAVGNLLSLTDPVDNKTTWSYDELNRVEFETNQLSKTRSFVYDVAGNLKQRTDRLDRVIVFEYDNLNRQTAEEWWTGTRPSIDVATTTEGFNTNEEQVVGFYGGTFVSGTFTLTYSGQTTSAIAWNASASMVQAALVALSNIGSGDVLVEQVAVEANERSWRITFGGSLAGTNVSQVEIDAALVDDGVGPPTETETTDTEGDGGNEEQVVTLSDATGGTFTLGFGGQTTAALNWDATTSEVDTALEALSGSGTISVSGSAGGPYTITFTGAYGKQDIAPLVARANNLTNADLVRTIAYTFNGDGDLAEVDDPAATYEFTYDDLGRVTDYVQNIVGLNPEIEFESSYDSVGRREVLQAIVDTDDDFKNVYAYDDLLRLTSLTQQQESGGNAVTPKRMEFNYNALGQYTRIDRYAATSATEFVASSHYSYDNLSRLLKLVHAETTTTPTGWGTDPLAGYQYTYDAGSRILSIDSYVDGLSEYVHDNTNQLVGADHNTATDESYEYDANGNRTMSGYSVGTNNQLSSDGVYTYTYDDEGNRATRTRISDNYVTRYEWDFRNRLTKVTEEDDSSNVLQVTEQTYDAFNQWIRREFDDDGPGINAAEETFFIYENGQIVLEFDGDTAADLSHRYTWGENVDQFFADETVSSLSSAGSVLWGLGDHLGTLRDLATYNSGTDDASIANHREYDSYGALTAETNSAIDMIFGYTSRPLDETTGAQNNGYRWYEAPIGRWMSEDPIGFAAGDSNPLRYVYSRPVSLTDPSGLAPPGVGRFDPTDQNDPANALPYSPPSIYNQLYTGVVGEIKKADFGDISATFQIDASISTSMIPGFMPNEQIGVYVDAEDNKKGSGNRWWISFKKTVEYKSDRVADKNNAPYDHARPWQKDAGFKARTTELFIDNPSAGIRPGIAGTIRRRMYYAVGIVCASADMTQTSELLSSFTYYVEISTIRIKGLPRDIEVHTAGLAVPGGDFPANWDKLRGVTINKDLNP